MKTPANREQFDRELSVLRTRAYKGTRQRAAGFVYDYTPASILQWLCNAEIGPLLESRCTANSAEMQLSAVISANAANLAAIEDGDWGVIAPYGDHPSPDKSYIQKFSREQAEKVVATWNSITGTAARVFKNLWHGLGAKSTCPVWDGHPETDKKRWPITKLLAEITDLRIGEAGLEGRLTWNEQGSGARTRGPLYPSSLWWHWPPSGEPPSVFPELLESVGLVPTPNISGVPAWAAFAQALCEHNGDPRTIAQASIDMSPVYIKGVKENCRNAEIVFDKFHVIRAACDLSGPSAARRKPAR
jgi:hypothetical protein